MHAYMPRACRAPVLLLSVLASGSLVACSSGGSSGVSGGAAPAMASDETAIDHDVSAADLASARSTAPIAGDSAVLYVNGLGCPLCASNIGRQLERIQGVDTVKVDLSDGKVDLRFKPGGERPSPAALGEAVEDAGFTLVKVEPHAGVAR